MDGHGWAYVDIKTVYQSSQVDPALLTRATTLLTTLPTPALERLLLYRVFLETLITAYREELKSRIHVSFWKKVKFAVGGTLDELFEGLDDLLDEAEADRFINVVGTRLEQATTRESTSNGRSRSAGAKMSLGSEASVSLSGDRASSYNATSDEERKYAEVLMRVFNVKEYILRLKAILEKVGIRHLYVFIDDFSELPPDAMQIVVDTLLAPLNNWSDELVKFKIAAYPNRVYYGQIDKTKIDEINLDIFSLYGTSDIAGRKRRRWTSHGGFSNAVSNTLVPAFRRNFLRSRRER